MNLRYRDERHRRAQPKHLHGIDTHREQAHSLHDLARAKTQVLLFVPFCACALADTVQHY